jgi:hypothetical protein
MWLPQAELVALAEKAFASSSQILIDQASGRPDVYMHELCADPAVAAGSEGMEGD